MIYINDKIHALDLTAAMAAVGRERREYALRYHAELDRRLSVAAFLLLQRALRLEFGIEHTPRFGFGPNGKPFLPDYPEIHFNLSHCREAAACVVDTHPVGIDVECIDHLDKDLLSHTMNDDEQQLILNSMRPDIEFIRLWTMKESLLKLTGQGISNELKSILSTQEAYRFHTSVHPNYICTVCTHA